MKKTKICFVMPYHLSEGVFGGAEVQAWLLAKELARRDYEVSYIAQSIKGKRNQRENKEGVQVRWVRYVRVFGWANGRDYYRALLEIDPDIVVQRMTSFITGIAGLYCRRHRKKFIWVCTDNSQPVLWFFLKNQRRSLAQNKVNLFKKPVLLFNALIYDLSRHWGMKQVAVAFSQNNYQEQALKICYDRDSLRMISGHEIPKLRLSPEQRLKNRVILWAGNLGPRKRPNKFLELARLGEGSRLSFIMAGGREDGDYLQALLSRHPLNLVWPGRLSFEQMLQWFLRAAFFINTSSAENEGFPNTFIQAWLHGVPVITLGVDPDGIIRKHKLGFVAKDEEEMLRIINSLFLNSQEYAALSARVFDYARSHHSVEKMGDHFLSILDTG
jgi:glycosyltransferase involved in cell wall biosynthesis